MLDKMKQSVMDDVDEYAAGHRAKRMAGPPASAAPPPDAIDPAAETIADGNEPDADQMGGPSDMDADNPDAGASPMALGTPPGAGGMIPMQVSPEEAAMIEEMRKAKATPADDMGGIDVAGLAAQLGDDSGV